MVFYLKYRPRRISELDSPVLRERLETALKGKLPDKISHAFLFTGPKGLGKTSTARILAKVINCTNRKGSEFEPCNKCLACKSIDSGANLDVLEIDGASNRGIDEIRDLREKIHLSPAGAKKKIYIIDEVHMLTMEAFNALLKTLEEPPAHAVFVLCTTEPQKIPETITSRCFHIKFSRATDEELVSSLKRIIKGEGLKADEDALLMIAQLSDGSFRDGAKILEEVSASTTSIRASFIEKKFNFASLNKATKELIDALTKKDSKKGINIISNLSREGVDFKLFTEKVIDALHKKLILEAENGSSEMTQTKNLISMLVKSHVSIKYAVLPQLPLELTIVEWCSQDEISNKTETSSSLKNEKEDGLAEKNLEIDKVASTPRSNDPKRDKILESLIEKVKKENFSIAGVLRGCSVERIDEKELVLSTGFKFHKERLSDKKVIELLESLVQEITGKKTKVVIMLKD